MTTDGTACRTAVVIPCYRETAHIAEVLESVPPMVDRIIVVDDACPEGSGEIAQRMSRDDPRIEVIFHERNRGVGGATITGYRRALEAGCDIAVKMDGDGQMDAAHLERLIAPLESGRADYAKGNRFHDFEALKRMPGPRLFGNSALTFLVKAASGYWNVMDPTNGYTAIHRRVLERLDLDRLSEDFFFESDMLIGLNMAGAVVVDVPMEARYGDEQSSLKIHKILTRFPGKLVKGMFRRVFFQYFIYDFNMASVYLLVGVPMFLFGVLFGAYHWIDSLVTGSAKPTGTIMLAALPIILSFQMLLQAIQIDIDRTPKRN